MIRELPPTVLASWDKVASLMVATLCRSTNETTKAEDRIGAEMRRMIGNAWKLGARHGIGNILDTVAAEFPKEAVRSKRTDAWYLPETNHGKAVAAKVAHLALLVVLEGMDNLSEADRKSVRRLLEPHLSRDEFRRQHFGLAPGGIARTASASEASGHAPSLRLAEFGFAWRPRGKAGRGAPMHAPGTGTVALVDLGADAAPVRWMLRTKEGWLGVRTHDGVPLRPLLSPGSWRPLAVEDFVGVATSGRPWRDDPFARKQPRYHAVLVGHGEFTGESEFLHRLDQEARSSEMEECLKRAGPLYVIGGVVHKVTAEPTLDFAIRTKGDRKHPKRESLVVGVRWNLGDDLSSDDVQDEYRTTEDLRPVFPGRPEDKAEMAPEYWEMMDAVLERLDAKVEVEDVIVDRSPSVRIIGTSFAPDPETFRMGLKKAFPSWDRMVPGKERTPEEKVTATVANEATLAGRLNAAEAWKADRWTLAGLLCLTACTYADGISEGHDEEHDFSGFVP